MAATINGEEAPIYAAVSPPTQHEFSYQPAVALGRDLAGGSSWLVVGYGYLERNESKEGNSGARFGLMAAEPCCYSLSKESGCVNQYHYLSSPETHDQL